MIRLSIIYAETYSLKLPQRLQFFFDVLHLWLVQGKYRGLFRVGSIGRIDYARRLYKRRESPFELDRGGVRKRRRNGGRREGRRVIFAFGRGSMNQFIDVVVVGAERGNSGVRS
jgi:hypothetical protein